MIDANDCARCKTVFPPGAVKARYHGESILCLECSRQWAAVNTVETHRLFEDWLVSEDTINCPLCTVGVVGYSLVESLAAWRMKCGGCGVVEPHLVKARRGIRSGTGCSLALFAGLPSKAFDHIVSTLSEEFPTARVFFDKPSSEPPF